MTKKKLKYPAETLFVCFQDNSVSLGELAALSIDEVFYNFSYATGDTKENAFKDYIAAYPPEQGSIIVTLKVVSEVVEAHKSEVATTKIL